MVSGMEGWLSVYLATAGPANVRKSRITGLVHSVWLKISTWYQEAGQGYVSGVLGALDAPGEWHLEDGRLYFWPPDGTDIASARVEVKRRTLCIDYNGRSHVEIKGINVTTGSVRLIGNSCTP
jgi:hypothetical protein